MDSIQLITIVCIVVAVLGIAVVVLRLRKTHTTTVQEPTNSCCEALGDLHDFSANFLGAEQVCSKLRITRSGLRDLVTRGKISEFRDGEDILYRVKVPKREIRRPIRGHRCGDCFLGDDGYIYDSIDMFTDVIWLEVMADMLEPCYCTDREINECGTIPLAPVNESETIRTFEPAPPEETEVISEPEPVSQSHSASWMADSGSGGNNDYSDSGGSSYDGGDSDSGGDSDD